MLNSPTVLETETKMICSVVIALEHHLLRIVRRKGKILSNSAPLFKSGSSTLLHT
jgi:hypothetical protein